MIRGQLNNINKGHVYEFHSTLPPAVIITANHDHNYPACAHAQQGVKQSVCLSSVVCCLLSVRTKIGKSQHLGKSRINKWDKMM